MRVGAARAPERRVADGVAAAQPAHVHHARRERHGRREPGAQVRRRAHAIQEEPGAHGARVRQRGVERAAREQARGLRRVHEPRLDAARARLPQHAAEDRELLERRPEIRLVGAGEVREDALQRSAGSRATASSSAAASSGATPIRRIPVSTSTCTGQRAPRARAARSGRLQVAGVVDDRRETERERLLGLRLHAAQHEDGERDARLPQRGGLGEARHREPPAAGGDQRAGDGNGAVAVGVRLHHRDHLARAREPARRREIRADRRPDGWSPGSAGPRSRCLPASRRRPRVTRRRAGGRRV